MRCVSLPRTTDNRSNEGNCRPAVTVGCPHTPPGEVPATPRDQCSQNSSHALARKPTPSLLAHCPVIQANSALPHSLVLLCLSPPSAARPPAPLHPLRPRAFPTQFRKACTLGCSDPSQLLRTVDSESRVSSSTDSGHLSTSIYRARLMSHLAQLSPLRCDLLRSLHRRSLQGKAGLPIWKSLLDPLGALGKAQHASRSSPSLTPWTRFLPVANMCPPSLSLFPEFPLVHLVLPKTWYPTPQWLSNRQLGQSQI